MNNGGYVAIDLSNFDLYPTGDRGTIDGLYAQLDDAFNTQKPPIGINMNFGGYPIAPTYFCLVRGNDQYYIYTYGKAITVRSDDNVYTSNV